MIKIECNWLFEFWIFLYFIIFYIANNQINWFIVNLQLNKFYRVLRDYEANETEGGATFKMARCTILIGCSLASIILELAYRHHKTFLTENLKIVENNGCSSRYDQTWRWYIYFISFLAINAMEIEFTWC